MSESLRIPRHPVPLRPGEERSIVHVVAWNRTPVPLRFDVESSVQPQVWSVSVVGPGKLVSKFAGTGSLYVIVEEDATTPNPPADHVAAANLHLGMVLQGQEKTR